MADDRDQGGGKRRGDSVLYCAAGHMAQPSNRNIWQRVGLKGVSVMDDLLELDEQVLTFDIPDEALERAASAERQASTWAYCTNGYYWYDCSWP